MKQENMKFAKEVSLLNKPSAELVYMFLKRSYQDGAVLANRLLDEARFAGADTQAHERILSEAVANFHLITMEMARDIVGQEINWKERYFWLTDQDLEIIKKAG